MRNKLWSKESNMEDRGGLPLRPPDAAISIMYDLITPFLKSDFHRYELVLLGITPEIIALPWPSNVNLRAYDQSAEMITSLWQGNIGITSSVEQACWKSLPVSDRTVDFFLGDGCTTQLGDENAYHEIFAEMERTLHPAGKIVMRCFIRPTVKETFDQVVQDAFAGNIKYFGSLKWRIALILANKQDNFSIRVTDIFDTFNRLFPDRDELSRVAGWTSEMVNAIDRYSGLTTSYTFPTFNQLEQLIKPWFKIVEVKFGNYELGDCCPILLLDRV